MKQQNPLQHLSHATQLQVGRVKLQYLQEDLKDFQAWNEQRFNNAFVASFEAALEAARDYIDDETLLDKGVAYTQKVDQLMEACRKAYKKLRYYVLDVFSNNPSVQNQFGFNDYRNARKARSRMIVFMGKLYRIAGENKEALAAEGYTQADIDELLQLRDQLEAANIKRMAFSGRRRQATDQRQLFFEAVGQYVRKVCLAGQLIYEAGSSRYERYQIPRKSSSVIPADAVLLKAKTKTVALNGGIDANQRLSLSNKGSVDLYFYGGETENEVMPEQALNVAPGEEVVVTAAELNKGQGFTSLIVWNAHERSARYLVKVVE